MKDLLQQKKTWLIPGLITLLAIVDFWIILTNTPKLAPILLVADSLSVIAAIGFNVIGGLIIAHNPRQIIGRLLLSAAFFLTIQIILDLNISNQFLLNNSVNWLTILFLWIDSLLWWLLVAPILLILQFFPTGKPINSRWRWLPIFLGATFIFSLLGITFNATLQESGRQIGVPNPIGIMTEPMSDVFFSILTVLLLLNTLGSFLSIFVRFRRAELIERGQIKWLLFACAIFVVVFIFGFFEAIWRGGSSPIPLTIFPLTLLGISLAVGIAILRHNLWNIDFVINRAIVYGVLATALGGLFSAVLYLITRLFHNNNTTLIAGLIAAGLLGLGFHPLRRKLQRFIDKRFYNIEIDYQKTPIEGLHFTHKQTDLHLHTYSHLELIGRGGMAEVYRAQSATTNDLVAIKILPKDLAEDADYRKRFEREVQVMRSLIHPNIVQVYDSGEESGISYIAMEYIRGIDLAEYLKRVNFLKPASALKILTGVAGALDFAHAKGLIHRDIKPSNIMLDEKGTGFRPVLMDFGVSKILGMSMMTSSGFLGTLDYIAPEQIQEHEDLDYQADIYSLAIMTYQMLTGEMPFPRKNPGALLLAHLSEPPPDIRVLRPELSASISYAIQRALNKKPADRFPSAQEFIQALQIA